MTTLLPVADEERIDALDIVRGVALFGVLLVNLETEFRVSLFQQFLGPEPGATPANLALGTAITLLVESKAFALFSLLFGVGLGVQEERARRAGRTFGLFAARRLVGLLAIGVVHLVLVWNGDILVEYAVAGLLALPLVGRRPAVLLGAAVFGLALFVVPLPWPEPFASGDAIRAHVARASDVYAHGGFLDVLAFRVAELRPIGALLVGALPRTCGLFLLGAWIHRVSVVRRPGEHLRALRVVALFGIAAGGAMCALSTFAQDRLEALGAWSGSVDSAGAILLALGYGAAMWLVLRRPGVRAWLSPIAALGRMALTNYLSQSVVLGLVFYGYGLGLFGKIDWGAGLAMAAALYVAQAYASLAWLRRFRLGPVERVWRSWTYGAWQPSRR